jgi:DNA-binding transcriptional LysR family regulator
MFKMHLTHVRRSDLNLLPALAVLLEERSISKAAARHNLSQPAMSRLLRRVRETFGDELLIRTVNGYELTARARRLQEELQSVLPKVDRMLRGDVFNPATAEDIFRICGTDSGSMMIASRLPRRLKAIAPNTRLELVAWHDEAFEDITHGRVDVLMWANQVPAPLLFQELIHDDIVCVVCEKHPIGNRPLTEQKYLDYPHVLLTLLNPWQSIVDAALGKKLQQRRIGLRVPYYGAAVLAVPGTDLIATMPRRPAEIYTRAARVRIVDHPFNVGRLRYLMAWHPTTDGEPALTWFREQLKDIFTTRR